MSFESQMDNQKHGLSFKPHKPAALHVGYLRGTYSNVFSTSNLTRGPYITCSQHKPLWSKWLAKPTKWLASRNAGRGRVMPPKSTPTPETSQSARAQATFASQKLYRFPTRVVSPQTSYHYCARRLSYYSIVNSRALLSHSYIRIIPCSPPLTSMPLEDLGEDVLLVVLSLCDIETVLFVGRVNRFLGQLTRTKQLWVALVEELVSNGFVDLPHSQSLVEHSAQELIALVKRTIVGPAIWSLQDTTPCSVGRNHSSRFVAKREESQVVAGRPVPARHEAQKVPRVVGGDRQETRMDNTTLQVPHAHSRDAFSPLAVGSITVIQVHLETGESNQLFRIRLPGECTLMKQPLAISGSILSYAVKASSRHTSSSSPSISAVIVVDWWLQKYVLIWDPHPMAFSTIVHSPYIVMARGHIMLCLISVPIAVYAVANFAPLWLPILPAPTYDDLAEWRSKDIDLIFTACFENLPSGGAVAESFSLRRWELALYSSPLRHDTYKLLVIKSGTVLDENQGICRSLPFTVLLIYRFSIASQTGAFERWEQTSAISVPGIMSEISGLSDISYSGYVVDGERRNAKVVNLRRAPASDRAAHVMVLEPEEEFPKMVSGYSHACFHQRGSALVVSYYV
ncbi:hypothetical protein K438DRAFT_1779584 [Mycena galopus ATCC 62051]|nr:hypothetical protein K438DRAFT_1779584 [Mycena galopus ATCC 62051]